MFCPVCAARKVMGKPIDIRAAFAAIGLDLPEDILPEEPKKEEKKERVPAPKESGKKKRIDSVELPVTIVTGYGKNFTLSDTAFDKKPEDVVMADVKKAVGNLMPFLSDHVASSIRKDDRTVYVAINQNMVYAKGTVKVNKETKCYLYDKEIPLEDIKTEEECMVDVAVINEHVKSLYPGYEFSIVHSAAGNIIAIIPGIEEAKNFTLPVTIKVFGREDIIITSADLKKKKPLKGKEAGSEESEDTDDEIDTEAEEKVKKVSNAADLKQVLDGLEAKYPEFKDAVRIMKGVQNEKSPGTVVLARFIPYKPVASSAVNKEDLYPTDGVVSFIVHRIQLKPEDFGGKQEVNKKELLAYLRKDYPELSEANTQIVYNKEKKLIMPTVKGSGKGAEMYPSYDEAVMAAQGKDYFLCNFVQGGNEYRMEKTVVSMTVATDSGNSGSFEWYIPKIPKAIFEKVEKFFRLVAEKHCKEALVWIYYSPDKKEYDIVIPPQGAAYAAVKETIFPVETEEHFRVMDIHSHGTIGAFFSAQDNRDEKGNRLFGVFGGFSSDSSTPPEFILRAGTGGKYFYMQKHEVFEKHCEAYDEAEIEEMLKEWEENVVEWEDA